MGARSRYPASMSSTTFRATRAPASISGHLRRGARRRRVLRYPCAHESAGASPHRPDGVVRLPAGGLRRRPSHAEVLQVPRSVRLAADRHHHQAAERRRSRTSGSTEQLPGRRRRAANARLGRGHARRRGVAVDAAPEDRPKPAARSPQPGARSPKPGARRPEPGARSPEPVAMVRPREVSVRRRSCSSRLTHTSSGCRSRPARRARCC